jgi:hypothetical protein
MQIKDYIFKPLHLFLLLLFLTVFSSFTKKAHPYYISVTEIRLNAEQKTVSLSCKMFTDDLQNALGKLYRMHADLSKNKPLYDSLINIYVKERMEVYVGNRKIDFKYVGYEMEEEATWCYFESKLPSDEKSIKVRSALLYDFIESQTNFLHCYYDKERKSFKLDNPTQSAVFTF